MKKVKMDFTGTIRIKDKTYEFNRGKEFEVADGIEKYFVEENTRRKEVRENLKAKKAEAKSE